MSRTKEMVKEKKEIVECAYCGFQYLCNPNDGLDLCECPNCKKAVNND